MLIETARDVLLLQRWKSGYFPFTMEGLLRRVKHMELRAHCRSG